MNEIQFIIDEMKRKQKFGYREIAFDGAMVADKRFKPHAAKKLASKRFLTLSRYIRSMLPMIGPIETCRVDFVGTMIQLRWARHRKQYEVVSNDVYKIVSLDHLLLDCLENDTGEIYSDEMLLRMVQSGCGRRLLFDPTNVPVYPKVRKERSDKGKPKLLTKMNASQLFEMKAQGIQLAYALGKITEQEYKRQLRRINK